MPFLSKFMLFLILVLLGSYMVVCVVVCSFSFKKPKEICFVLFIIFISEISIAITDLEQMKECDDWWFD
jgi:hypothetical protein